MDNSLPETEPEVLLVASLTKRSNSLIADCNKLIDDCLNNYHQLDITKFAKEWREKNFHLIFCGYAEAELPAISSELYDCAKGMMLSSSNSIEKKVAALFLLYGLYNMRNSESKIRLTLSDAKELDSFLDDVQNKENGKEVAFILNKLFLDHAFIFCATANEYCPTNYQQNTWDEQDEYESVGVDQCQLLNSELFSLTNGFEEIKIFSKKYEEFKRLVPGLASKSAVASRKNFPSELVATMEDLKSRIEPLKEKGSSSQPGNKRKRN